VEDLKQTLLSCRAVAESVVTPASAPGHGGDLARASGEFGPAYGGSEGVASQGVGAAMRGGRGAGAITRAFFMAADADGDVVINRDELIEAASALA